MKSPAIMKTSLWIGSPAFRRSAAASSEASTRSGTRCSSPRISVASMVCLPTVRSGRCLTGAPLSAWKLSARHQPRANESQEGKNGADNEYRARNRREGDYQLKKLKRDRTCCACGSDSDEDANEF